MRSIFITVAGLLVTVSVAPAQQPDSVATELEQVSQRLTAALSRIGGVRLYYQGRLQASWEISDVSLQFCVLQGTMRFEVQGNVPSTSEFKLALQLLDLSSIGARHWQPVIGAPFKPAGRQAWQVVGIPINRRSDAEHVAELLRSAAELCGAE